MFCFQLRDDTDPEVKMHMHHRDIEMVLVHPSDQNKNVMELLLSCIRPRLRQLFERNVGIVQADPERIGKLQISQIQRRVMDSSTLGDDKFQMMGDLGVLSRLVALRDTLKNQGAQQCIDQIALQIDGNAMGHLTNSKGETKRPSTAHLALKSSIEFRAFREELQRSMRMNEHRSLDILDEEPAAAAPYNSASAAWGGAAAASEPAVAAHLRSSHPKMVKLVELVTQHFSQAEQKERWMAADDGSDSDEDQPILGGRAARSAASGLVFRGCKHTSNVIIFTELRDTVDEIMRLLQRCEGVRPAAFIGQAKKLGGKLGMNQKAQAEVLSKFRDGTVNVMSVSHTLNSSSCPSVRVSQEVFDAHFEFVMCCFCRSSLCISVLQPRLPRRVWTLARWTW